jgi:hypothetical protein
MQFEKGYFSLFSDLFLANGKNKTPTIAGTGEKRINFLEK